MNDNFSNNSINLKGNNIKESNNNNIIKGNYNLNGNSINNQKDVNNIDNKEKKKKIYNFNFSKIINIGKSLSDDKKNYSEIQFNCNICLNFLNIDIANKINAFSLLTYINLIKDPNYVYYLNNRMFKYIVKYKGIDNFFLIKILYRFS